METERFLYLVTEYASKGEIFGKTASFVEERGREERKDRGREESERWRERENREGEGGGESVYMLPIHLYTLTHQLSN